MKSLLPLLLFFILFIDYISCSNFVEDVDPAIGRVEDDLLNDESQLDFLITGVRGQFAETHDRLVVLGDDLSDQTFFDLNVRTAVTFAGFFEIDEGVISFSNRSINLAFLDLGELRFFADDLFRRLRHLEVTDAELARRTRYTGYLFGGIARYLLASYFGLNPTEGGGVEDNSRFIPSDEMYERALERFQKALIVAGNDYETKVINSLIARTYLYKGDNANASTFAQNGLIEGDPPFQSLYNAMSPNNYWSSAGRGRTQLAVDNRFFDYITQDPNEAARIQIEEILGNDSVTIFYRQIKYPTDDSPINFISWQENELMLAELELNTNNASAFARVNAVRASQGIEPLSALDRDTLIRERDKQLFLEGARLVDQRRFGLWHLGSGTWQYLPIPESERNNNPCLNDPSPGDCEPPPLPD